MLFSSSFFATTAISARSAGELPFALLFSLLFCFPFLYLFVVFVLNRLAKKERRRRFAYQRVDLTLNDTQDTITLRIHELNEKYREIERLLAQSDNVQNAEINEKLETAQIARYELHNLKINLVHLQNGLLPVLYEKKVSEKSDEFLDKVNKSLFEIKDMRQSLTDDYAIEFTENVLPEKENFLAQLDETKASCEKLRESLLNRQAAHTLQSISRIKDNLKLSSADDLHHTLETFNIQTAITDFSESFEELEREYKRLKAENANQKIFD